MIGRKAPNQQRKLIEVKRNHTFEMRAKFRCICWISMSSFRMRSSKVFCEHTYTYLNSQTQKYAPHWQLSPLRHSHARTPQPDLESTLRVDVAVLSQDLVRFHVVGVRYLGQHLNNRWPAQHIARSTPETRIHACTHMQNVCGCMRPHLHTRAHAHAHARTPTPHTCFSFFEL